jgi:hypothetical protein
LVQRECKFGWKNLKERDILGKLDIHGKIILKWNLHKQFGRDVCGAELI